MKMGTRIDEFLKKNNMNKGKISESDYALIEEALKEINKMSSPGDWGVIYEPYLNKLTSISFFGGAAVTAGTIAMFVVLFKIVKKRVESDKSE